MKTLDLNQMEKTQGGELTPEEACLIVTGVGIAFIATGFLSFAGAAVISIAVGGVCNQV